MSVTEAAPALESKSRKRNLEAAEIEIDVDAPEPPSKKALRKAKKGGVTNASASSDPDSKVAAASSQTQDSKRSNYGIWIGNLSFATTKEDLLGFFTGDVSHPITRDQISRVHLPQGQPKFGKPCNKGFAYLDFTDAGALKAALEFSEALLGGRRVLIKDAKNFEGRPELKKDEKDSQTKAPSKRIFIGNLDFDTTAEALEEHFGVCGTILHTHMATFEDTGKCKGFAWIEFEQLASAEAAMRGWVEARGGDSDTARKASTGQRRIWLQKLNGRKLRMEFAEDKATRYQKRFGKGSKGDPLGEASSQEQAEPIREVKDESKAPTTSRTTVNKNSRPKQSTSKYGEETVQRLTGAIVESKGKKVVFD